ncbi:DUF6151 family protein [Gemmobacter lutimaris]|nr:DUF6151 family protein [Gemmobacter lutimaris]
MTNPRQFLCTCGTMRWEIAQTAPGTHVECYCADCQSFARHLKVDAIWLDAKGGTEIFQTLPQHIRFTAGYDRLSALRLGPKGLIRWYAGCCGAPIGNSLPHMGLPFFGAILKPGQPGFGPLVCHANTAAARQPVAQSGMFRALFGLLSRALPAKIAGSWRRNPFFSNRNTPVVRPEILTLGQRNAARPPQGR